MTTCNRPVPTLRRMLIVLVWMFLLSDLCSAYTWFLVRPGEDRYLPVFWDPPVVEYIVDRGPLSKTTDNAAGVALVQKAFQTWEEVPSAEIQFQYAGLTDHDITWSDWNKTVALREDGVNEVVFDRDGTIVEAVFGQGASRDVLAYADILNYYSPSGRLFDGIIVVNGTPEQGDILSTLIHEIGHFIGQGHTFVGHEFVGDGEVRNDGQVPTMYPLAAENDTVGRTLEPDDIAGIFSIYPTDAFLQRTGAISGTVLKPDGTPARGVHVMAIRLSDPRVRISNVSDYLAQGTGSYDIVGLAPGEYYVLIEPIPGKLLNAHGSGIGPLDPPERTSGFPAEFYNGPAESDHPDPPYDRVPVPVTAAHVTGQIDFVLNDWEDDIRGEPNLIVTSKDLTFPNLRAGDTQRLVLPLFNIGGATLIVSRIYSDHPAFAPSSEEAMVDPGEILNLTVTFSPSSEGEFHGTLTIESNDPAEPRTTVSLKGGGLLTPSILWTAPPPNARHIAPDTPVRVQFDRAVDGTTLNEGTVALWGAQSGFHTGGIAYEGPSQQMTIQPARRFLPGETVTVALNDGIRSSEGLMLGGYLWSFTVEVGGTADGLMVGPSRYQAGQGPSDLYIGDLDRDGDLDLAVLNEASADVTVFSNTGDGSFPTAHVYPIRGTSKSLRGGDLDQDGDLDIAIAEGGSGTILTLLNRGDGIFSEEQRYPAGFYVEKEAQGGATQDSVRNDPSHVYMGDMNGDGSLDLGAVSRSTPALVLILNRGEGKFGAPFVSSVEEPLSTLIGGDLNRDGSLDLIGTSQTSNRLHLLFNARDGQSFVVRTLEVGDEPRAACTADLDGDGDLDLAVAGFGSHEVKIFLNDGRANFSHAASAPIGGTPTALRSADLDGDGDLDLIGATSESGGVSVLFNLGGGSFFGPVVYDMGAEISALDLGDLDGDGDLDIAAIDPKSGTLSLWRNEMRIQGDFNFDRAVDLTDFFLLAESFGGPSPSSGRPTFDLNGDGRIDLLDFLLFSEHFGARKTRFDR